MIRQRRKRHFRMDSRVLCYPLLFRQHVFRFHCTFGVSPHRFCNSTPSFPPPGPLRRPFPGFISTMRALRLLVALVAALRCLRLAIPCRHPTVRSCASSDALPHRPGLCYAGVPPALPSWRQRDLPGSWATRSTFALLSDPGRASVPSRFGTPVLPPLFRRRRPQQEGTFEAQSHGFCGRCLRFADGVAPDQRKTRFRLPATLYRVGLATHRVATKSF